MNDAKRIARLARKGDLFQRALTVASDHRPRDPNEARRADVILRLNGLSPSEREARMEKARSMVARWADQLIGELSPTEALARGLSITWVYRTLPPIVCADDLARMTPAAAARCRAVRAWLDGAEEAIADAEARYL